MKNQFRRRRQLYRIQIPILSRLFPRSNCTISIPRYLTPNAIVQLFTSSALYLLGPVLIVVTGGLVFCLSWTFWNVIIPLRFETYTSTSAIFHQAFVVFILLNVVFNYISCVTTSNTTRMTASASTGDDLNKDKTEIMKRYSYDKVVRELARATGFKYPESPESLGQYKYDYREMVLERARQRRLGVRYQLLSKYGLDEEQQNPSDGISGNSVNNTGSSSESRVSGQSSLMASPGKVNGDQRKPVEHLSLNDVPVDNDALKRRKTGLASPMSTPMPTPTSSQNTAKPMGRSWMWLGPYDWSFCDRTEQPKPPRSHYDHVTKSLILNMDHYCPWMFNVIGYFNYRYFVNFLIYVTIGMTYGSIIAFQPFMLVDSPNYHHQIVTSRRNYEKEHGVEVENMGKNSSFRYNHVQHLIPGVPVPNEAASLAFSFMICFAVGISVAILLGFHLYLIFTAQTTIEFHGNRLKKEQCMLRGEVFSNPYDMGLRRNIEQVWGRWKVIGTSDRWHWLGFWTVLLPSWRENEFLPVPLKGDVGRRCHWSRNECDVDDNEDEGIFLV